MPRLRELVSRIRRRSAPAQRSGPEIVYAPERDGDPDPGEVVWAWVPYEDDADQGKDRPVLVIGYEGSALLAVPLSSKDHTAKRDAAEWVEVGQGGWDGEGRVSFAHAERVLRYRPSEVRREGAALRRDRFDAVVAQVRRFNRWIP